VLHRHNLPTVPHKLQIAKVHYVCYYLSTEQLEHPLGALDFERGSWMGRPSVILDIALGAPPPHILIYGIRKAMFKVYVSCFLFITARGTPNIKWKAKTKETKPHCLQLSPGIQNAGDKGDGWPGNITIKSTHSHDYKASIKYLYR